MSILARCGHILANAPAEPQRDPVSVPASLGVWSVWNGDPRNDDDEVEAQPIGTYRGYVDTIALAIAWSDRDVAYFRREADDAPAQDLQPAEDDPELPECVGLNVIQGEALLSDDIAAIEPFFAGRPVFVKYSGWGNCVALFPATGEAGAQYICQQAKLRAVLSKLTADDVAILKTHGLETTPKDHYSPSAPLLVKGANGG